MLYITSFFCPYKASVWSCDKTCEMESLWPVQVVSCLFYMYWQQFDHVIKHVKWRVYDQFKSCHAYFTCIEGWWAVVWQVLKADDDEEEEDLYCSVWRERKYNKVQTCLGLETFTAHFRPSWTWGFFKACPVILTGSYKTDSSYIIYIINKKQRRMLCLCWRMTSYSVWPVLKDDGL